MAWVRDSFTKNGYDGQFVEPGPLKALQLDFRLEEPLTGVNTFGLLDDLMSRVRQDEEFALDVLDWMLHNSGHFRDGWDAMEWSSELGEILRQGGSVWEVVSRDGDYQLSRRTAGPVVEVLEKTATESTRAHEHLRDSWSKLTGRNPDASGAYREAVRAVEAVGKPIILPNNSLATLGQMIPALRDKPEKWTTRIGSVEDIRAQMEAVWKGQLDRHGTDDETVPLTVSPEEADAAFSACLNLVRQFVGGHIVTTDDQ